MYEDLSPDSIFVTDVQSLDLKVDDKPFNVRIANPKGTLIHETGRTN